MRTIYEVTHAGGAVHGRYETFNLAVIAAKKYLVAVGIGDYTCNIYQDVRAQLFGQNGEKGLCILLDVRAEDLEEEELEKVAVLTYSESDTEIDNRDLTTTAFKIAIPIHPDGADLLVEQVFNPWDTVKNAIENSLSEKEAEVYINALDVLQRDIMRILE